MGCESVGEGEGEGEGVREGKENTPTLTHPPSPILTHPLSPIPPSSSPSHPHPHPQTLTLTHTLTPQDSRWSFRRIDELTTIADEYYMELKQIFDMTTSNKILWWNKKSNH